MPKKLTLWASKKIQFAPVNAFIDYPLQYQLTVKNGIEIVPISTSVTAREQMK